MGGFFRSRGFVILLAVIAVLAILIAVTYDRVQVTFIEDAVNSVLSPIQSFSVKASNSIINFFERVFSSFSIISY